MKLKLHRFDLPLRHTFTISRESIDSQPTLIVELQHEGLRGFGEATSNAYYGFTLESMSAALDAARDQIEAWDASDPLPFWDSLQPVLSQNSFALCALDQAAHDLWGKTRGKSLIELWGLSTDSIPRSNYTIGIDSLDVMAEKLREFSGWPIYKIKLGGRDDLGVIRRLREETDATFRVDANCGWTPEQCLQLAPQLKELGVEFIEQPLPAEQMDAMRELYGKSELPLIADESCIVEGDVEQCVGAFHGVNVKLVKCGGLTPARRMLQHAKRLGLRTMVGCMTESTVGISAIAQLLPMLDYVDMDGAVLLDQDIASGSHLEKGVCVFSDQPGTGAELLS
jgi:L-alanine-DL-glutamate epimerase-like enolase superfamily enzyme